jgi:hypothetical protein
VDASGAIDLQLVLFQLFFMVVGLTVGVRVVDDVKRWREARVRPSGSADA